GVEQPLHRIAAGFVHAVDAVGALARAERIARDRIAGGVGLSLTGEGAAERSPALAALMHVRGELEELRARSHVVQVTDLLLLAGGYLHAEDRRAVEDGLRGMLALLRPGEGEVEPRFERAGLPGEIEGVRVPHDHALQRHAAIRAVGELVGRVGLLRAGEGQGVGTAIGRSEARAADAHGRRGSAFGAGPAGAELGRRARLAVAVAAGAVEGSPARIVGPVLADVLVDDQVMAER